MEQHLQQASAAFAGVTSSCEPTIAAAHLSQWCLTCRAACDAIQGGTLPYASAAGFARLCAALLSRGDLAAKLICPEEGAPPALMVVLHAFSCVCCATGPSGSLLGLLAELCRLVCDPRWAAQYGAALEAAACAGGPGQQAPAAVRMRCLALLRGCLERSVGLPDHQPAQRSGSRFGQAGEGVVEGMATVPPQALGGIVDPNAPLPGALSAALSSPAPLPFSVACTSTGLAALLACSGQGSLGASFALDSALSILVRLGRAAPSLALIAVWDGSGGCRQGQGASPGAQLAAVMVESLETMCAALCPSAGGHASGGGGGGDSSSTTLALLKRVQGLLVLWVSLVECFPLEMLGAAAAEEAAWVPLPPPSTLDRFLKCASRLTALQDAPGSGSLPQAVLALPATLASLALGLGPTANGGPSACAPPGGAGGGPVSSAAPPLDPRASASLLCALVGGASIEALSDLESRGRLVIQLCLLASAAASSSAAASRRLLEGLCHTSSGSSSSSSASSSGQAPAGFFLPHFFPNLLLCGGSLCSAASAGGGTVGQLPFRHIFSALCTALEAMGRGAQGPLLIPACATHLAHAASLLPSLRLLPALLVREAGSCTLSAPPQEPFPPLEQLPPLSPPTALALHTALVQALCASVRRGAPQVQRGSASALMPLVLYQPSSPSSPAAAPPPRAAAVGEALSLLLPVLAPPQLQAACGGPGSEAPPPSVTLHALHVRVLANKRELGAACALLHALAAALACWASSSTPSSPVFLLHDIPARVATAASLSLDVLCAVVEVCDGGSIAELSSGRGAAHSQAPPSTQQQQQQQQHHHQQQQQQQQQQQHHYCQQPPSVSLHASHAPLVLAAAQLFAAACRSARGLMGCPLAARHFPPHLRCVFQRAREGVLPHYLNTHLLHCQAMLSGGSAVQSALVSALHKGGELPGFVAATLESVRCLLSLGALPAPPKEGSGSAGSSRDFPSSSPPDREWPTCLISCLLLCRQVFALADAAPASWAEAEAQAALLVGALWQHLGQSSSPAPGEAMGALVQAGGLLAAHGGGKTAATECQSSRARSRGVHACAGAAGAGAATLDARALPTSVARVVKGLGVKDEAAAARLAGEVLAATRSLFFGW